MRITIEILHATGRPDGSKVQRRYVVSAPDVPTALKGLGEIIYRGGVERVMMAAQTRVLDYGEESIR